MVYRRIVFASAQGVSFADASESLAELSELKLLPKRVWRAAQRIGEERVEERREAASRYQALPLPAQHSSAIPQAPKVVCVQMDGGRFQERKQIASEPSPAKPESDKPAGDVKEDDTWREYKAGVLLTMQSETHAEDPCPQLPATFADPAKMRQIAREIKGFTSESPVSGKTEEVEDADFKERLGRPTVLVKSVVATSGDVDSFGPLLIQEAYARGFHAAERKAFVADGSSANWGVWKRFFSHYTPIVDFVHALMYVYAAAMAGIPANEGWTHYREWSQWLWSGQIDRLLEAMRHRLEALGFPEQNEKGTPRAQVARSWIYLTNQGERMKYPDYRQQGLPITSSAIESTIKQINRRIKGTEKFWGEGADPMLHLIADRLSQTSATADFWERRLERIIRPASNASCKQAAA